MAGEPQDDWQPVTAPGPGAQQQPAADWQAVKPPSPDPDWMRRNINLTNDPSTDDVLLGRSPVGNVLRAFGHGAAEGWGEERLGFSDKTREQLQKWVKDSNGGLGETIKGFTIGVMGGAAELLDAAYRTPNMLYHAAARGTIEMGLPRDIAAMPEAFMGTMHPTGTPPGYVPLAVQTTMEKRAALRPTLDMSLPVARDLGVIGPEAPRLLEGTPAVAAANAVKPVEAWHGSPHVFDAFKTEAIGTGEGAASFGHGFYLAEERAVGQDYAERLAKNRDPTNILINGEKGASDDHLQAAYNILDTEGRNEVVVTKEMAEREYTDISAARRSQYMRPFPKEAFDSLVGKTLSNTGPQPNLYQVRIHADKDHFLDWDKPLSEQSDHVRNALAKTGIQSEADLANAVAEAGLMDPSYGGTGADVYHHLKQRLASPGKKLPPDQNGMYRFDDGRTAASDALHEAGIPGIKYLDQGSRSHKPLEELQQQLAVRREEFANTPKDQAAGTTSPYVFERERIESQINRLEQQIQDYVDPTHNLVVFDPARLEITHRNGELVRDPNAVPEQPPVRHVGGDPADPLWSERIRNYVAQLKAPEDVRTMIQDAINEIESKEGFMAARSGDISLGHADAIAAATGMAAKDLDIPGLSRTLKNDVAVRVYVQAMIESTSSVRNAMRDLNQLGTDEAAIKLQQARLQHGTLLQQVVGLRAEWGRTGNVLNSFLEHVKDAESLKQFMNDFGGKTPDDLKRMAKLGAGLDETQLPRFLADAHKKTFGDWLHYYWMNAILSGFVTHTKYIGANSLFALHDAMLSTTAAAGTSKVLELAGKESTDKVFFGEAPARLLGMIRGTPDAIYAVFKATKTGEMQLLPPQIVAGVEPFAPNRGFDGIAGNIIGLPSRPITGIHTYFNFIGYRSELEAQAYRSAAKEGLNPLSQKFWQKHSDLVNFPTDEMMEAAVKNGARLTFTTEPGPMGRAFTNMVKTDPTGLLKYIVPFRTVPVNIMKSTIAGTPFAILGPEMRANLMGKNGPIARDTQWGQLVAGSSLMGWAAMQAADDRVTGEPPSDAAERKQWLLTHQPYSVRIGDNWVSYKRFGSIGDLLGLSATLWGMKEHISEEDYHHAAALLVKGTSTILNEGAGVEGISMLVEALADPDKKGARYVNNLGSSFIPYSSFLGQGAAFLDPQARETKTFLDSLKYKIPVVRESLPVKRDWTGQPVANPMYHTLMRTQEVNTDPVALEMQNLAITPTLPSKAIRGVALTPEQYDEYLNIAGPLTHATLERLVKQDGWYQMPAWAREDAMRQAIRMSRGSATATMQMRHPELVQQAIQDKVDRLQGN